MILSNFITHQWRSEQLRQRTCSSPIKIGDEINTKNKLVGKLAAKRGGKEETKRHIWNAVALVRGVTNVRVFGVHSTRSAHTHERKYMCATSSAQQRSPNAISLCEMPTSNAETINHLIVVNGLQILRCRFFMDFAVEYCRSIISKVWISVIKPSTHVNHKLRQSNQYRIYLTMYLCSFCCILVCANRHHTILISRWIRLW